MKWKLKKNGSVIVDENDKVVCIFPDDVDATNKAIIRNAIEMFDAIMDFSQSVDSTVAPRKPKKHYERFQKILERINETND